MDIQVGFSENLRLDARFEDFSVKTDQPIRYKGDGSAPSPFDYFLASSALCAAYFVKVYCKARDLPTDDIQVSQSNVIDPENRYLQTFKIRVNLPEGMSEKHKLGLRRSIDRCTVKKVIQAGPSFDIELIEGRDQGAGLMHTLELPSNQKTRIPGKDLPLEDTIRQMTATLEELGIRVEIASWRNLVPYVWSVHIRDADSPLCFTNGKGATKESALCSALGEYMERISCNYFYNDQYLGADIAQASFVHYPDERWFKPEANDSLPAEMMDDHLRAIYDADGELRCSHLLDTNSGLTDRGVCSLPFMRQSDQTKVYIPVNLIANLFVSNGMSAGNTMAEARVQALSEIFERAVKKEIIEQEMCLPDVPEHVLKQYPNIQAGLAKLEEAGFPLLVKDASLGGRYPVMCVILMNPKTGGLYASFGAHPRFEVALERSLTELLQGRSFEGLNDVPLPTFSSALVADEQNFVEHFIDSTGVLSWKTISAKPQFEFCHWDFGGETQDEDAYLLALLAELGKEVYIAEYQDLGACACRILVPGYSEIYPVSDLIWDNHNRAIKFRQDILCLHTLDEQALEKLCERLEHEEIDHQILISELIGIEFDENTMWGQLRVGELKILIHLALNRLEEAQSGVEEFLSYNDHTLIQRRLFYQAMQAVLHVCLSPDLNIADFEQNLARMFGGEVLKAVLGSVQGKVRFSGLEEIGPELSGQQAHLRFIESYKKLHRYRARQAGERT